MSEPYSIRLAKHYQVLLAAYEAASAKHHRVLVAMQALQKQQWPFSGPILVEETNPHTQQKVLHLVHGWCYLGQVNSADDALVRFLLDEAL